MVKFPPPPADTVWCCNTCSRWLTAENPQRGRECEACIADDKWDEIEHPVAFVPVGAAGECAGCGQPCEAPGMDLCWGCDSFVKF